MSGTMRECLRALNTVFSATTVPYPLPDDLRTTIDSFLDRYDDIDHYDSQRFHQDLHTLYLRHVAGIPDKHGSFLSALRLLQPVITGETHVTAWWDLVLKPTIDGIGHKRHELEDAREFLQNILVYDVETDRDGERARLSSLFTNKVLHVYLARTIIPSIAEHTISAENDFVSHELESILVTFGRRMPKPFLLKIDELFVQKQHRFQALNLLSAFVRLQPPHLHLVLETSLIHHLEKCLLIDTASLVIEVALAVLIMFLPHICGALTSDHHLQKLFLVYVRILCWDKLGSGTASRPSSQGPDMADQSSSNETAEDHQPEQAWEQLQESLDYTDAAPPSLKHYYTFLYGLFPLNFMSFVRKPRKYLKSLNFPGAHDFDLDEELIHRRTEPYRKVHLLHTNMFTTTVEEELGENRWLKSDPVDVVTQCIDLCVAVPAVLQHPGPPPDIDLPPLPDALSLIASNDKEDSSSSEVRSPLDKTKMSPKKKSIKSSETPDSPLLKGRTATDSPTLPPIKEIKKQDSFRTSIATFQTSATQSPSLQSFVQSLTTNNSPKPMDSHNQSMALLHREIMLLRNDLAFERYLKSQHLSHIGRLQRKHVKEATADAETQNLINTNKILKSRLTKANDMYAQLKKETLTSRNQSKKWESDLSAKVRLYKESEKTLQSDEGSLRFKLLQTSSDYEHLKEVVEKAESQQLKAQQRTRAFEHELEEYENIRRELKAAQEKVLVAESQKKELGELIQERNGLRNELEIAQMRLNSREQEHKRSNNAYERHIITLEKRLQTTESSVGKAGQLSPSVQQMLDSTLAASGAKLNSLKKAHYRLLEQYTELQMKYYDLEGAQRADNENIHSHGKPDLAGSSKPRISRSSSLRQVNNYNPKYLPPLSTEMEHNEEQRHNSDHYFPESVGSPRSATSFGQSARFDSIPNQKPLRSQTVPTPYHEFSGAGSGLDQDISFHNQSHAESSGGTRQSSSKSSFSVDTDDSLEKEKKNKVAVKSEVRVYGRGGAQNIGKKVKEKETKKAGSSKTGGFRGLKGIM